MYCEHCGSAIYAESKFCSTCGGKIQAGGTPQQISHRDFARSARRGSSRNPQTIILISIPVLFLIVAGFWLISGSLGTTPSLSDATNALNEQNQHLFKVRSLRKVDGQAQEMAGIKFYRMDFEAEIECTSVNADSLEGSWMGMALGAARAVCRKVGERQQIKGSITFARTENRWRAVLQ